MSPRGRGQFLHILTVKLEIFSRVLFSQNFAYAKFLENRLIKSSRNGQTTLSLTDIGKSCPSSSEFLRPQICLLTLFAKISEFTVYGKLY